MLQKLKVLQAGLALHRFSVRDVARYADVPEATVRTVLERHKQWFRVVDKRSTGRRGGSWKVYEATSSAAEEVAVLLDDNRQLLTDLGPASRLTSLSVESRLSAAEELLLVCPLGDDLTLRTASATLEEVEGDLRQEVYSRSHARASAARLMITTLSNLSESGPSRLDVTPWAQALRALVAIGETYLADRLASRVIELGLGDRPELLDVDTLLPISEATIYYTGGQDSGLSRLLTTLLESQLVQIRTFHLSSMDVEGSSFFDSDEAPEGLLLDSGLSDSSHGYVESAGDGVPRSWNAHLVTADHLAVQRDDAIVCVMKLRQRSISAPVVVVAAEFDELLQAVALDTGCEFAVLGGLPTELQLKTLRRALHHQMQRLDSFGPESLDREVRRGLLVARQNLRACTDQRAAVSDSTESAAGSPPTEVARYAVGVEVMPEKLAGVVSDSSGMILASGERGLESISPADVAREVTELVDEMRRSFDGVGQTPTRIVVGVQIGGPVDPRTGVVHYYRKLPPYLGGRELERVEWREEPFGRSVERLTTLPVLLENDANAFAAKEQHLGSGRETRDFVVLLLREGLGGSIVRDGQLFSGPVEIGQVKAYLLGMGRSDTDLDGTLETLGGTTAILSQVNAILADASKSASGMPFGSQRVVESIDEAVALTDDGSLTDDAKRELLEPFTEAGSALARAIAYLIAIAGPERVMVYVPAAMTNLSLPAVRSFHRAVEQFRQYVAFDYMKACEVQIQAAGPYDGALGVALLALERDSELAGGLHETTPEHLLPAEVMAT